MSKNKEEQLGWLSPTGEFIQGNWGDHETVAEDIIADNNWLDEYAEWRKTSGMFECRDFLVYKKHYILIDDPELCGEYQLSYMSGLTKVQMEFLYGILVDNHQNSLANRLIKGQQ